MPLIDLYVPQGVLGSDALESLAHDVLAAALEAEGYAHSKFAASISWTYVHEVPQGRLIVGMGPPRAPVYRIEVSAPAGSLDAAAKAKLGSAVSRLVLEAEGTDHEPRHAARVWCIFRDVPDGDWQSADRAASAAAIRKGVAKEKEALTAPRP